MIVMPKDQIGELDDIIAQFPGSRVVTRPCMLFGKPYVSLQSSNLDLLLYVAKRYSENSNPDIARL